MEIETVVKNLPTSSNTRRFLDGSSRSVEKLRSAFVGWGTYKPGWRWSEHAGKQTGRPSENHIGYVLSGRLVVKGADGPEKRLGPGDAFELPPGHDAWVDGDEPCVALDFGCLQNHNS